MITNHTKNTKKYRYNLECCLMTIKTLPVEFKAARAFGISFKNLVFFPHLSKMLYFMTVW